MFPPLLFLFLFLFSLHHLPLLRSAPPLEREALLDLRRHLPAPLLSSWDPHTSHCSWSFVSCDPTTSLVLSLHLPPIRSPPSTTFVPRSIGRLKHLRSLSLPSLGLRGPFPLPLPPLLHSLDLRFNSLSGPLPCSLPPSLRRLLLASNRFHGPIPPTLSIHLPRLQILDLSWNLLSGSFPTFPAGHTLTHLNLSSNLLTGQIPSEIGSVFVSLSVLDVSKNRIRGRIPETLALCRSLLLLDLSTNRLTGPIPHNLTTLPHLKHLSFSGNDLDTTPPDVRSRRRSLESTEPPPPLGMRRGFNPNPIEIASISSAAAIVSVLFTLIFIYLYTRKCSASARAKINSSAKKELTLFANTGSPSSLTYESVARATGNFSASNCIGSGGFGATYKAEIAPGEIVAIKKLFVGKIQGTKQFHAEIEALRRWRHSNLVTLFGFHASEADMFLIYNYLPGGNLEKFISNRQRKNMPVEWRLLHKIALGIASALSYLHNECVPRILHRDVKPSNILLDNDCNAYLSDFGLSRLLGYSETHATTGVEGTFGYVAPEYATTCRVSDKADVYSYGVVLLELLSDKKVLDPSFSRYGNGFNIVAWASILLKKGQASEFFTQGLWEVGPSDDLIKALHLALRCTDKGSTGRPTMKQVVKQLERIRPLPMGQESCES